MNTRILILGKTGMLGGAVFRTLVAEPDLRVQASQRTDPAAPLFLDARAADVQMMLRTLLAENPCDYVVNCIGLLAAAITNNDANALAAAIRVNALFPHLLADIARELGVRVIHMSTDGVFSGLGQVPYVESSVPDAPDTYGRTKSLGESSLPNTICIRCSVVGVDRLHHRGLIEWFLSLKQGAQVTGYDDTLWNGVTTLQFARVCRILMLPGNFDRVRAEGAVHHLCPNPPITKYRLLSILNTLRGGRIALQRGRNPLGATVRLLSTERIVLPSLFHSAGDWSSLVRDLLDDRESAND